MTISVRTAAPSTSPSIGSVESAPVVALHPSSPAPSARAMPASGSDTTARQTESLISFNITKQLDVSLQFDGMATTFVAVLLGGGALWRYWRLRSGRATDFELNEAEFGLGQQKIKLKANDDDRQIAYKIWVELSTRKIGLPIDLEQDVITEVYDSWHTFFSVTRELIKDVPVRKYQRDSTTKIVRLSIEVLNEGLRPHLTKWQARFRRWYEHAAKQEDFGNTAPQEIQRQFPAFSELAEDMKLVNERLITYRTRMHELITKR
ncbi:hypothetical protein ACI2S5_02925 [Ralstonia nicotianae]